MSVVAELLNPTDIYLPTFLMFVIALLATADSWRAQIRARRAERIAREYGNGRSVIASGRLLIAHWFLIGFISTLVLGVVALINFVTQIELTFILRYLFVFIVFAFWRAKRANRAMGLKLDALDERESLTHKMDNLTRLEEDTNTRVKDIKREMKNDG